MYKVVFLAGLLASICALADGVSYSISGTCGELAKMRKTSYSTAEIKIKKPFSFHEFRMFPSEKRVDFVDLETKYETVEYAEKDAEVFTSKITAVSAMLSYRALTGSAVYVCVTKDNVSVDNVSKEKAEEKLSPREKEEDRE